MDDMPVMERLLGATCEWGKVEEGALEYGRLWELIWLRLDLDRQVTEGGESRLVLLVSKLTN